MPATRDDASELFRRVLGGLCLLLVCLTSPTAWTQDEAQPSTEGQEVDDWEDVDDYSELTLEELMAIPVTSVAGVAQDLRNTPAAIYILTGEDLRRSGHRSVMEALRMVPGVNVARISANAWAISGTLTSDDNRALASRPPPTSVSTPV